MANVELDSTVYTTFQNPTKFPEYYLATFQAQIEIIKNHSRWSIYHPKLMQTHLAKIFLEDSITEKDDTYNMEITAISYSFEENNMYIFNCI